MKVLLSVWIFLFIPFFGIKAQVLKNSKQQEILDRQYLLKQLLIHQKGACSCAIKYHHILDNFASVSGRLNAKSDTSKYFFQFGKVYHQIGGHRLPAKKRKDN